MGKPDTQQDARFAAVAKDPRFARFPKRQHKVQVDDRFKAMFTDDDFAVTTSTVSKRGAKRPKKSKRGQNEEIKRYYRLNDEDEADQDPPKSRRPAKESAAAARGKDAAHADPSMQPPQVLEIGAVDSDSSSDAPDEAEIQRSRPSSKLSSRGTSASRPRGKAASSLLGQGDESQDRAEALNGSLRGKQQQVKGRTVQNAPASDVAESSDESGDETGDEDVEGTASGDAKLLAEASGSEELEAEAQRRFLAMRGLGPDVESSDSSEDEGSDAEDDAELDGAEVTIGEDDDVFLDESEWGIGAAAGRPDADTSLILLQDATRRLAVVDLEWSRMRAVDILAVLQSFIPAGKGRLEKVAVYVSDYGQKAIQEEQKDDEVVDDEPSTGSDRKAQVEAQERIRMYERSKLRWYFAVATFDSAVAANHVYEECDGHEFEESATTFDLRFVPDGEDFASRQVRDEAASVPADYKPPIFQSKALQHSKPTLTWDEDSAERKTVLRRKVTADELKEDDFKAFLASDSSDDDDSDDDDDQDGSGRNDPSAAATSSVKAGGKTWTAAGAAAEDAPEKTGRDNLHMEVTFASGLEGLGKRMLEKVAKGKSKAGDTLFEQYLRRKKEKRAEQRAKGKHNVDSASESDDDKRASDHSGDDGDENDAFFGDEGGSGAGAADAGFDDDFFNDDREFDSGAESDEEPPRKAPAKAPKRAQGQKRQREDLDPQQRAELELLMLDDSELAAARDGIKTGLLTAGSEVGAEGGKKRKLSRKQRIAQHKAAWKASKQRGDSDDEAFEPDLDDPRFADLSSYDFAIDPSHPSYARLKDPQKLIGAAVEKRKKKQKRHLADAANKPEIEKRVDAVSQLPGRNEKSMKSLVNKVKRSVKASDSRSAVRKQKSWG